jgi:hypothetical protein
MIPLALAAPETPTKFPAPFEDVEGVETHGFDNVA